jgi:hypothetical protein
VPPGDLQDRVHVGRQPVKVDDDHGLCAAGDPHFQLRGIEGEGARVDVDEDRLPLVVDDRGGRGEEGEGSSRNNFVTP